MEFTMRRGRAVKIKMSSATAWTNRKYDKSTFRKSDGELFQTFAAVSAKGHVSETAGCTVDSQRPCVCGTQLSCAYTYFK